MSTAKTASKSVLAIRKLLLCSILAAACFFTFTIISMNIYLQTDHAAALLSDKLTAYFNQPVRIAGLRTAGGSVQLSGVSIGNPADHLPGNIFSAESIGIAPHWWALLAGRRVLRHVSLAGVQIGLLKNSTGDWNYSGLQRRFGGKKSAGKELLIEEFTLKDGAFKFSGHEVQGISFQLFNLTTKGSQQAEIRLAFEDAVNNVYTVSGTARPGAEPAFDLTLTAPALSLKPLAGLLQPRSNPIPEGSSGNLKLTAALEDGRLRAAGRLDFSRRAASGAGGGPASGAVTAALIYSLQTDEVNVESLEITADHSMRVNAAGTIKGLRSERSFGGTVKVAELNLAELTFLLPEKERQKTRIAGSLRRSELRFAGTLSQGLSRASGELTLADAALERDRQLWFKGLNCRVTLTKTADGFLASGKLSQGETSAALLENLQAPFSMGLSRKLKPLTVALPSLKAVVMGLALNGRLGYNATAPEPYTADLRITSLEFAALPQLSGKLGLQLTSGSGSLDLKAAGRGGRDFTAKIAARIGALEGKRAATPFGLKNGTVDTQVSRRNGRLDVRGRAILSGLAFANRHGDARFSYQTAAGEAIIEDGVFSFDGATVSIARFKGLLPRKEPGSAATRYPLVFEVAGGELRRGKLVLQGVSGNSHGSYLAAPQGKWLEGSAYLAVGQVIWQGQAVAAPAAKLTFSRSGALGVVSGELLKGGLRGEVDFDPLALKEGGKFQLTLKGGHLAELGGLLPKGAMTLASGRADVKFNGAYGGSTGLDCRFDLNGSDIALTGKGGKTFLGDGGIKLAGSLAGSRLVVDQANLSAGKEVSLEGQGTLATPFAAQRQGGFTFAVPRTSINSFLDQFVNMLPRPLQEATTDGSLAGEGLLTFRDGKALLEGSLQPAAVLLEIPSQKLKVAGVNGRIPFSLYLAGESPAPGPVSNDFSRENYPKLLRQFSAAPLNGQGLAIGGVEFGSVNLGEMMLQISSAEGVTRIDSLRGKLYEGALLGSGFVKMGKGGSYRVDLLVNGLSLKQFCASIPKIKNYISGRLDGVISLKGGGKDLAGLLGFTDLWVREGSGEKMLVSKEFLQKLSGKKLSGLFFSADRPFDRGEVAAVLEDGYLTFRKLDIVNTNLFGVRDLSVSIAPDQNRIAIDHLLSAIREAAQRGKKDGGETAPAAPAEFKWDE